MLDHNFKLHPLKFVYYSQQMSLTNKKSKMSMMKINLEFATRLCSAVVSTCNEKGFNPVAVCVVNSHGNVICSMIMDDTPLAMQQFALAKATTAVTMKMSSRKFRDTYNTPEKSAQMMSMIMSMDGKICNFPGSILLLSDPENKVVGSIGVSGARSDQDEWLALNAVRVCGFDGAFEPSTNPLD